MILKTMHNENARATIGYVAREGAILLGGNMLGLTVDELTRELELLLALRPSLSKPVVHFVGAFAPEDRLTDEEMLEVACRAVREQGYAGSLYAAWRHLDGTTDHFHVVTAQVDMAGRSISDSFERYKAKRTCRGLEREFGLQIVSNVRQKETETLPPLPPPPEPDGLDIELPDLTSATKEALSREIREALPACKTLGDLAKALHQRGIAMVPQIHSENGEIYGMGYRIESGPFSGSYLTGSAIPGNFSSTKLVKKHGLSFDPERDLPVLRNPQPQPSHPVTTPIPAAPQPHPRRTKKGDRRNARSQRKSSRRAQPQIPNPWGFGPNSLQSLIHDGAAPQDTRLVRSILGHPHGWASPSAPVAEPLFPGQRAGQRWVARSH